MQVVDKVMTFDATGLPYQELNARIRAAVVAGAQKLYLKGVNGQRYLGAGLVGPVTLEIEGVPGNNLAAMADGITVVVHGNAQDGIGNTMNEGRVVVHGSATDILGYGMRGGKIFIRDDAGYRVGIHMKAFAEKEPLIVIGGTAGDFLGEYMAGGRIVLLGRKRASRREEAQRARIVGNFVGTGIHGGAIYIRGQVTPEQCGREVRITEPTEEDRAFLQTIVTEFAREFGEDPASLLNGGFLKLAPASTRPYGKMYA